MLMPNTVPSTKADAVTRMRELTYRVIADQMGGMSDGYYGAVLALLDVVEAAGDVEPVAHGYIFGVAGIRELRDAEARFEAAAEGL